MRILAFDTCTQTASVAVVSDGETLAEIGASVEARHGETLLPRIQSTLELAGLPLASVDLLAVGIGPGSFTGVRVGLATAKGLALATGKPLRGVTSLRTLARGARASEPSPVAAVLDAYKGEVYLAVYAGDPASDLAERLAPLHAPPEQAAAALAGAVESEPVVLCGNGARRYAEIFASRVGDRVRLAELDRDQPSAVHLAEEARLDFAREGPGNLFALEPLYLRPSDARLPADARI